jgi:hypothetical protein
MHCLGDGTWHQVGDGRRTGRNEPERYPPGRECEVGDDFRGVVDRDRLTPRGQRRGQLPAQAGGGDRLGEQNPASLPGRW